MSWAMAIPAIASSISGMAGQASSMNAAKEDAEQAQRFIGNTPNLVLPDTNYNYIDYAGDYNPYAIAAPEAAQYQTISEDPQTREIEMQALQQLVAQANGAADAKNAAARWGALDDANMLAKSREGAIQQRMERSGQGGTGLNAVLQAQSAQAAANRARAGTMDAVTQAALQKLSAQQMAMQGAGALRGEDFRTNAANSDIVNRFNQFNTAARNRINEMNTGNMNEAQLRNLGIRQDLAGRNTGIGNANIDRQSNRAKTMYDARMGKNLALGNAAMGKANLNMQQAPMYNQMGQQGAQLFTNIGSGIAAAQNSSQPQKTVTVPSSQDNGEDGTPYDEIQYR